MDRQYIPKNSIVDVPYAGEWVAGAAIKKGEFRTYGGLLFMAKLAHTSTAANAPYADPAVIYARQYRGTYSATTTYAKYDSVTSAEGNQYLSLIENNLAHTPPTDGTDSVYWACYARRGPDGPQGDPGGEVDNWSIQEIPTGVMDGSNKSFTIAHTPTGTVEVLWGSGLGSVIMINGIDYTYTDTALTLITFAPDASKGEYMRVRYPYNGSGLHGASAYVYIAWASDAVGTNFTMTFDASLDYIAIKNTTSAITSPTASDFSGLWKYYKGNPGGETGYWAIQEIPSGTRNGVNQTFTLAHTPVGPVAIKFNGREYQNSVDYTNSGTALTLITFAPDDADGDKFWVTYPY